MSQYGALSYRFAVKRVQHARAELAPEGRTADERLLLALVALAPLVRGDLPPDVSAFYDRVKRLVGREYWALDGPAGGLESGIRAMTDADIGRALKLLEMAVATMDRYGLITNRPAGLSGNDRCDPVGSNVDWPTP